MAALKQAAEGGEAVLVSERGEAWSTEALVRFLRERLDRSSAPTAFLLGGDAGFRVEDEAWARRRLGLSRMTLPHEVARLVLAEQVYRALTIMRNVPYHK